MRFALERTTDSVFVLDRDWRFTFLNRRAIDQIATGRDLVGQNVWDAFPEAVGGPLWAAYRRCMADRVPVEAEQFYAPLGRTHNVRAFPDETGGLTVFFRDVTEERAAEVHATEREARLRLALDAAELGTWRWEVGNGTDRLEWDARCRALFGLPPDAVVDYARWAAAILEEDRATVEAEVSRALDPTDPRDDFFSNYQVQHPDGTTFTLYATGRAFFEPDPLARGGRRTIRILGAIRDVTARRRAEAALAESERRFRSIFNTAADGIIVADSLGMIVSANPAALRLFGYEDEAELVGHDMAMLMPQTEAGRHGAYLAAHRMDSRARVIGVPGRTLVARRRDGSEFPIALSVSAFKTDRDRCFTGIIRDVTRDKEVEAALLDRGARLDLALRCASLGVYEVDVGDGLIRYDARASQLSNGIVPPDVWLPMEGPEFRTWREQTHPDDRALRDAKISEILSGEVVNYQCAYRCRNGGEWRHLLATATVLERDAETHRATRLVGVLADVTDRVEAEAKLERLVRERTAALVEAHRALEAEMERRAEAQEALLHTHKMEALGQLASSVAHDFNNILLTITATYELIEQLTDDPRVSEHLQRGGRAAARAATLVNQLLAFGRREKVQSETLDLRVIMNDMRDLLRHTLKARVALTVEVAQDAWPVRADPQQLQAALLNLAANARDAMPGGGTVHVCVRNLSEGERPSSMPGVDCVEICVRDNGTGIPPELLARVTERFFTTKPRGQGTGLGLAMVRDFAEQSDGLLSVTSEPGEGTRVSIILPRATAAPQADTAGRAVADSEPAIGAPRITILVAEDDEDVRELLALQLAQQGYIVREAEDGDTALALIESGLHPQALVTDFTMPGSLHGLDLLAAARCRLPRLPGILVSGDLCRVGQRSLETAERGGPFAALPKPVALGVILERLEHVLRQGDGLVTLAAVLRSVA